MENLERNNRAHHCRSDGHELTNKRVAAEAVMHTDDFDFDYTCSASNAAAPTLQYQPHNASGYIYCRPWEWPSKKNKKPRKRRGAADASDYLTPELFGVLSSYLPKIDNLVIALKGADRKDDYYKAAIEQIQKVAAKKLVFDTLLRMARPVTFAQLYDEMRAIISPSVLRLCLVDMVGYDDITNKYTEIDASCEYSGSIIVEYPSKEIRYWKRRKSSEIALYSIPNDTFTKKLIFDTLHELGCPVNIEELHQKLDKVDLLPLPLLREYLDKMINKSKSIGVDDEMSISKEPSCRYSGSVIVKEGSDSTNTFFYVNHTPVGLYADEDIDTVEEDDEFDGVDTFEDDDEFEGIDNFNDDEFEDAHDLCLLVGQSTTETRKDTEATQRNVGNSKSTPGFTSASSLLRL